MQSILGVLSLVLISALGGGLIAHKLRIPAIIGYIGAGLLIGFFFPQNAGSDFLRLVAETGVTLLLFTIGLESSFFRIRKTVNLIFWSVLIQVFAVFICIFAIALFILKIPYIASFFTAIAAAFSSTAVSIKLLGEKNETETIYGELVSSWLILQDFIAVPFMVIITAVTNQLVKPGFTMGQLFLIMLYSLAKSAVIIFAILYFGKKIIPRLLNAVADLKNREMFILSTVTIIVLFSGLTRIMGIPAPVGAFLVGILISQTSQNHAIFSEIRPLRDIFSVIFFSSLGLSVNLRGISAVWIWVALILPLILLSKWIIVYVLSRSLQFHRKTATFNATYLLPVSEFGFILASTGLSLEALNSGEYGFITVLTFGSILIGGYAIVFKEKIYKLFIGSFGRMIPKYFATDRELSAENADGYPIENHVVLCGYGRVGKYVGRSCEMAGIPYIVVDYNLNTLSNLRDKNIPVVYGDPSEKDILDYAQVDKAKAVIIALPDRRTQEMIIAHALSLNRNIKIFCRTHFEEDQQFLKSLGVTTVVQPEFEASLAIIRKLFTEYNIPKDIYDAKVTRLKIEHGQTDQ